MQDCNEVKQGMKVRTTEAVNKPGATRGMMISPKHLDVREAGVRGTVMGYVPGHGGDVWWVQHENGVVAAYCFDEFETV